MRWPPKDKVCTGITDDGDCSRKEMLRNVAKHSKAMQNR